MVLTFCLSDVIKEKGTSYESVTFQGTMFNKSYQLYRLINTKSLVTQCYSIRLFIILDLS